MQKLQINGGKKLEGDVNISGAKNAALPLIAATLLSDEVIELDKVPNLSDVETMVELLSNLGAEIKTKPSSNHYGKKLIINPASVNSIIAPYEIVRKMRASIIVLGGLLARSGQAEISLPGGCAIGARPINYHLEALKQMGVQIDLEDGYVKAKTIGKKLQAAEINFPMASVGATQNIMIAAVKAEGKTIINNAAREPEIKDLADLLNKMGAKITGAGRTSIEIEGVDKLSGAKHEVIADRIEAGTFLIAAPITKGRITVKNISPEILRSTLDNLKKMNVGIEEGKNEITAFYQGEIKPIDVETACYPGFPTDMQAQITALMCVAGGVSTLKENIFENRFMHIPELVRMGADIQISGNSIVVKGNDEGFKPAEVMATDLRASVSLVLAALNAKSTSRIDRLYHLDRGYEKIEEKLSNLGAEVERLSE